MDPRLWSLIITSVNVFTTQVVSFWKLLQFLRRRRLQVLQNELNRRRRRRTRRRVGLLLTIFGDKPRRRAGVKRHKSTDWWDNTVTRFFDKQWLENFRFRRGTFQWICGQVHDVLAPHPNPVIKGQALSVEKMVAIALYKLAHLAEYQVVANQFGVCKSSVHNCVYAFCYAITSILTDEIIKFPSAEEAEDIARKFEETTNIPQLIGAIDESYIPITPPKMGSADFYNRSGYHSVVLQAIVDHQYLFRDISCKLPGSNHDADVLRESAFFKNLETLCQRVQKMLMGWIFLS